MPLISTLLWDNDGVLVDTEPLYFRATREILAEVGVDVSHREFLEINIVGGKSVINLASRAGFSDERLLELREARDQRYSELLSEGVKLTPGIKEVLSSLAVNYRMAIVTSCHAKHFDIIHQKSGLLDFFEKIIKREDYKLSKPHPEPYLTAMRSLGSSAAESLAIEDSPRGLASARAAGLDCIVHQSEFTETLDFPGALCFAPSISDIPDIISSINARVEG